MSHTLHTSLEEIILTVLEKNVSQRFEKRKTVIERETISWKKRPSVHH